MPSRPTVPCVIEWDVTDTGVRAIDAAGNGVFVRVPDWQSVDTDGGVDAPTDACTTGVTAGLSLASSRVHVSATDTGAAFTVGAGQRTSLDDGSHTVTVSGDIDTVLRFDGPATVQRRDGTTTIDFDGPRPVVLGFRSAVETPVDTVTVPRTLDGVATAVSVASAAHRTTNPDRTLWSNRRHPPRFEFGDAVDVPDRVATAVPDTGVELVVPESLRALFLTAPVAFFLGADVRVEPNADPRLRAPDAGVEHVFDDLVEDAPATLARVFWLECLARNGGPNGTPELAEHGLLEDVGIDHGTAHELPLAERLALYLDAPFGRIADEFPEWHLSMHVAPEFDAVPALPFVLDSLAFVYPPETEPLEGEELMERSLDDFFRAPGAPIATVEMVKPKLREGRAHGWLADGTPIDVFKTLPEAYDNHLRYLDAPTGDELSVAVVLNDRKMAGEQNEVAAVYEERSEDLPMSVTLHENLTCEELADLFAEHHEFVHYIGHCEVAGLRCADGNLSVADLPESNVETFFLNACGSYHEGLELVKRGSVAGAVTLRRVLDEQAATVGTAFARLLVHGFPIDAALRLARRRIMMGKDYAVVGDGMQTLSHTDDSNANVAYVSSLDSGAYRVRCEQLAPEDHGAVYRPEHANAGGPRLSGNDVEFTARPEELTDLLDGAELPVILDGEFHWSDEARAVVGSSPAETDSRTDGQ
ncbi:CHAT domain-containing protein [Halobacterium zhouii]|uniref:CHAT domain-containing protein n=1 Tax=Halobacterium zhouii TaxID=2902624 RepID=UPI001E5D3F51|nr:CHAT domain-containing protein [Halobacterium zhouii]